MAIIWSLFFDEWKCGGEKIVKLLMNSNDNKSLKIFQTCRWHQHVCDWTLWYRMSADGPEIVLVLFPHRCLLWFYCACLRESLETVIRLKIGRKSLRQSNKTSSMPDKFTSVVSRSSFNSDEHFTFSYDYFFCVNEEVQSLCEEIRNFSVGFFRII
jgi:hypothetical protein